MLRVYIPGDVAVYRNYARAVRRAGAVPCFTDDPADCGCLLLPGGGDLSPMLYGQTDIACRGLDPARDALEMDLLNLFTSAHRPVPGNAECERIFRRHACAGPSRPQLGPRQ